MSEFHATFTTWAERHPSISLRGLAAAAGLASSELSNLSSGKKSPTFATLEKLLPAISRVSSRNEARTLLVAHLRDETPTEFRRDVRIMPTDERGDVDQSDPITQEGIRWDRRARTDPEFAKMWLTLGGYTFEGDANAVDARVDAFVADQSRQLGLTTPASRTLGQILAAHDLHALSERSHLAIATLQRLIEGSERYTEEHYKALAPALTIRDAEDLRAVPFNSASGDSYRYIYHAEPSGLKAAEDPKAKGA